MNQFRTVKMRWFLCSLILAVLNCEAESESAFFPSYHLNKRSVYSKFYDHVARPSVANVYPRDGFLVSLKENLGTDRKKRHLNLEPNQSLNRFHKSFSISEELPKLLDHFEQNNNLKMKRNINSSKEQINKQLSKREDIVLQTATDTKPTYELQYKADSETSTLIDQRPFLIDSPSEPAPHVYKDELTDEIIINSRTSPDSQTTSLASNINLVNLYTDIHYNDKGNTAENALIIPSQVSSENVETDDYTLSNPPENLKLSVDHDSVHDSNPPYVETLTNTLPELTSQNNNDESAPTPIRPGYPEVILPKEKETEVILPKLAQAKLNKDISTPKTQPSRLTALRKFKPRLPFVTPFNPYITLFLPSAGSSLYHLPLQVPILNLPMNPYY